MIRDKEWKIILPISITLLLVVVGVGFIHNSRLVPSSEGEPESSPEETSSEEPSLEGAVLVGYPHPYAILVEKSESPGERQYVPAGERERRYVIEVNQIDFSKCPPLETILLLATETEDRRVWYSGYEEVHSEWKQILEYIDAKIEEKYGKVRAYPEDWRILYEGVYYRMGFVT